MSDYFLIAVISSTYGSNGFVKIKSFTDFPDRFFNLKKVYLDFFDDKKEFIVEEVNKIGDSFTLKFAGFNSKQESEELVGKEIFVDSENLVKLPENYYFIHDLISSVVLKNGVKIGVIEDVQKFPANDVYVLKDRAGKELLIPAVADFIESFDVENKVLILKPGVELYEDDEN